MPGLVAGLLSCWHQWLGKHNSNIWNLIPGCLMWNVWLEQNRHSFENMEKTLDELKVLCRSEERRVGKECCCDRESVDHSLAHCPVTHTLWTFMLQAFGIHWVMPRSVAGLLSCWH